MCIADKRLPHPPGSSNRIQRICLIVDRQIKCQFTKYFPYQPFLFNDDLSAGSLKLLLETLVSRHGCNRCVGHKFFYMLEY